MPQQEIKKGEIIIYKDAEGPTIQVTLEDSMVWLSPAQMAELFQKDAKTIGYHIRQIYKEKELEREKTSHK